jgi:16S rRNA (uracil1498-N3)-methyltransferase
MHRFYCPTLTATAPLATRPVSGIAVLDPQEAHHARRVLRLRDGDLVEVFDGRGTIGRGRIECKPNIVQVHIAQTESQPPPTPLLEIAAAVPKGPRADHMVEQLSQLGVDRLILLRTQFTVVDPRPGKLDRFRRAAVESAKQSGRAHVMSVDAPMALAEVLGRPYDLRLIADVHAGPHAAAPADVLPTLSSARSLLVLIGPEGGWTAQELTIAEQHGCVRWSLGPHVMRIETAAVAAAAILRYLATETGRPCLKPPQNLAIIG